MNIDPKKSFLKHVDKIADPTLRAKIKELIAAVKQAKTMQDIPKLKKVKGCKKGISYRIRVGDYRIGVEIVGNVVTFVRCQSRKDIYKSFP